MLCPPLLLLSYLSRNVALDGIGKLALAIGTEAAVISLSTLQKCTADKVPNVRFNAVKALRFVAPLLPSQDVASVVLPIMKNLSATDSDVDVRLLCAFRVLVLSLYSFCISGQVFRRRCSRGTVVMW